VVERAQRNMAAGSSSGKDGAAGAEITENAVGKAGKPGGSKCVVNFSP